MPLCSRSIGREIKKPENTQLPVDKAKVGSGMVFRADGREQLTPVCFGSIFLKEGSVADQTQLNAVSTPKTD